MNGKKHVVCIILVFFNLFTCLTGCNGNLRTDSVVDPPSAGSGAVIATALTDTEMDSEPRDHHETINADFHINATVVGVPTDSTASVYTCVPKDFSEEEIDAFVSHCGESIVLSNEWNDGSMEYLNGECTNGYQFGYMRRLEGLNNHPYAEFRYYDTERYRTYYDYPIYSGGEENYITNSKYTVGWMFTTAKDFSFATKAEAEAKVRETLALLGLSDLTLLRTLYVDHQTLAQAGKLLVTDQKYAPIGTAAKNNGFPLRANWSEDDDAYMFSFGISVSGIPMSYLFDDSGETATYCGSEIIVWYTKYGITFLSISTPWTIGVEVGQQKAIVSEQAVLDVVKEKYKYDLYMEDKQVEDIRLLYRYFQNRNQWLLRPTWCVHISYFHGDPDERYHSFMYIDALTGKEL